MSRGGMESFRDGRYLFTLASCYLANCSRLGKGRMILGGTRVRDINTFLIVC